VTQAYRDIVNCCGVGFDKIRDSLPRLLQLSIILVLIAVSLVSATAAHSIPEGFSVQRAAAEPEIRFPMFATLDERGRLFVAESSGLDLYKEISAGTRKCQVRLLEDRDRDGKYETAKVFADNLVFPMGLVWREGKLYIADPPDLITLEDMNGDDRADKRTVILSSFGAKDNGSLHGLVFGPDGLLYMTTGEPDGYRFELPGGKILEGISGALIRCRADGSNPEVLSRGFENLVEVVFMPGGEIIGTDNWYQHPQAGIRDALLHLVEGGLYPMKADSGTPQPVTGDLLPPLSLFPAVALSGLMRYEGAAFPREFHGNIFSAQHNSRSIGRHILRRQGSTFVSQDTEFLTTDDPDFHPSDVLEDRDGSLLVLDTGSWYTDHCPTGKIRKSPAAGGIYRVRYTGKLSDAKASSRARSVWLMTPEELREALRSSDIDVAASAARVFGLRHQYAPELLRLVSNSNPPVQLAAAEALARCGDSSVCATLTEVLTQPADRFLEHAVIHALHHLASEKQLLDLLTHDNARVQKAALLLLSQPPRPNEALKAEMVLPRVSAADVELRATALKLLKSRPAWSREALRVVQQWLAAPSLTEEHRTGLQALTMAFFHTPDFQAVLRDAATKPAFRDIVLEVASKQSTPKDATAWTPILRKALTNNNLPAARVANAWQLNDVTADLKNVAADPARPVALRKECLRGVIGTYNPLPESVCEFLLDELRGNDALTAGELLRKARLTDEQVIRAIKAANALVPPASLLVAFYKTTSAERSRELVDLVARLPVAGWHEKEYAEFVKRLPPELQARAQAHVRRFRPDREVQHARLAKYEPLLRSGDAERGRAVFASAKVACMTCHAIGNQGGRIGPDLTRLGAIRSGRDILESILFPNSTFAQNYEPFIVETKDDEEHSGILVEQDEQRVVLRAVAGDDMHFSKTMIKELRRATLSIMPEGLEAAMTEQEFRDLLAFLQSLK
jgi:putative membrane-bound dehydrogenase-like protein